MFMSSTLLRAIPSAGLAERARALVAAAAAARVANAPPGAVPASG
jgi:hypothetical protein